VFAKHPPKYRYFVSGGPTGANLVIPAGAENAEVVSAIPEHQVQSGSDASRSLGQSELGREQNCFMGFLVDPAGPNPKTLFRATGVSLLPRGTSGPTLASLKY
jgi:hypothetical protein